jgi:hypothetical protein
MSRTYCALPSLVFVGLAASFGLSCGGSSSGAYPYDAGADASAGTGGSDLDSGAATGGSSGGDAGSTGSGGEGGSGGSPEVSCRSDTECTPYGKVCDAVAKQCVDCLFDSTCDDGEHCRDRSCVDAVACETSLDCSGQDPAVICDQSAGTCEECTEDADCGADGECMRHVCSYFVRCTSSLNCPQGQVCDIVRGRCAACVDALDCESGQVCYDGECTARCISDKDCVADGKLCDKAQNACVACLEHAHCPQAFYCKQGACILDECESGAQACDGAAVLECTQIGDAMQSIGLCGAQTTCRAIEGDAECAPWICTAGQTYCEADHVIQCGADGLTVLSDRNCAGEGMICWNSECHAMVCQPSTSFCAADYRSIQLCAANGMSSSLQQNCLSTQYCDGSGATPQCRTNVCTPNAKLCVGQVAHQCNAIGSGYVNAGSDCSTLPGTTCSAGSCVCAAGQASCDGDATNGCEINTANNTSHCGGCNLACSTNNISAACASGACTGTCASGFADCDSDKRTNGCERPVSSDVLNCGGCNVTCSTSNITRTCNSGVCDGVCADGFADCDGNKQTNGCEAQLATNVLNCGECSRVCSTNNITRTCSSGQCTGTCNVGFDDCDGNKQTNGCEVSLLTDEQNCGSCGNTCDSGQTCVNGVCGTCNNQVLLLGDSYSTQNGAIKTALDNAGLVTTLVNSGITSYAGTPAATGFGAVLLVVGDAYTMDMPVAGQTAVVNAHSGGAGIVMTEWAGYHVEQGRWTTLKPLMIFARTNGTSGTSVYTSTNTTHPIWSGLPSSFSIGITMGFSTGAVANGGTSIATVTPSGYSAIPAVVVKDAVGGRQVHITHAASYQGNNWTGQPNLVTMFTNAARWATRCF